MQTDAMFRLVEAKIDLTVCGQIAEVASKFQVTIVERNAKRI